MTEFFDILFSLPTAIFTWPLMVVALYWIVALSGLFDFHALHGADGALDGAADGALDGAADGIDGSVEAAAHTGEGGALAHHEPASGSLLDALDFGTNEVPRTLVLSLLTTFAWVFSLIGYLGVPAIRNLVDGSVLIALALALAYLLLGWVATVIAIQPLRRMSKAGYGPLRRDLLGQTCTITTQRVDAHFGQAELADGSSLIQVRCRDPSALSRGSQAVIFDYDADSETFWVTPLDFDS